MIDYFTKKRNKSAYTQITQIPFFGITSLLHDVNLSDGYIHIKLEAVKARDAFWPEN